MGMPSVPMAMEVYWPTLPVVSRVWGVSWLVQATLVQWTALRSSLVSS